MNAGLPHDCKSSALSLTAHPWSHKPVIYQSTHYVAIPTVLSLMLWYCETIDMINYYKSFHLILKLGH